MGRHILITGGAGNLGGSLARRLVGDPQNRIVLVDNLLTGDRAKLPPRTALNWEFIEADVNDWPSMVGVMRDRCFDYVFHYAAVVGVRRTLDNPARVLRDIHGIENILKLARDTGVKKVFYSSSSEVYGESTDVPQNEISTPLNARLPYAVVKSVGEAFLRSYHQQFGLDYCVFRYFNIYGPLQSRDFVISKFIALALSEEDITVFGDGNQSRTYCFIDDALDVMEYVLDGGDVPARVLNVGGDEEITALNLARKIIDLTNSRSRIAHYPPLSSGDVQRRKPDLTRMLRILDRPLTSLDVGLRRVMAAAGPPNTARIQRQDEMERRVG